jgi:signal transduction histidine kinase
MTAADASAGARPAATARRVPVRAAAPLAAWTPWLAAAGVVVCAGAVVIAASGARSDAAFGRGLLELLIVGVPIAVGLYAVQAPENTKFGIVLLGIGFAWSLTAFAETSSPVLSSIGRVSTWVMFPCVVYLLLAFPAGRIARGPDRLVFLGVTAVLLFLFIGTAPLVAAFPPKTLWSSCTTDCPPNAFFVLDRQPAFLTQLVLVREWLVELLWIGLFASMLRRWRAASPLQRHTVAPAFVAGTLLGLSHYAHITARQLGAPTDFVVALSSAWTFCIVAVCAAFLFGLVWRRMLMADTLAQLGAALRAGDGSHEVRDALATALHDSTTELLFRDRDPGAWHDAAGRRVDWPRPLPPGRAVTTIGTDRDPQTVALVHDAALRDDRRLLDGVSGLVLAGWRDEQLRSDLNEAMQGLEDSRRRIAAAADLERVRIQRDLHDGAQQRLIALRIRLTLAEEQLVSDPTAGLAAVREIGFEADRALEELRSFAHGVYPATLIDLGLRDALRSIAAQAPLPVRVAAEGVTRHPIEIESAVYFTCAEAIQNAIKHAHGATGLWIALTQTATELRFEVRDDGPGFRPGTGAGRGLRNMRDRIEAIDGTLVVDALLGHGTRISGAVGLSPDR